MKSIASLVPRLARSSRSRILASPRLAVPTQRFARSFSAVAPRAAEPITSFCFQCEQTEHGTGCKAHVGVCGKTPTVSALQDLFIYQLQGISQYAHEARKLDAKDADIDLFILEGMFSTLTNVNFDQTAFERYLAHGERVRADAKAMYEAACKAKGVAPKALHGPAVLNLSPILNDRPALEAKGLSVGVMARKAAAPNDDIHGLAELSLYGLKGMMAYTAHARALGQRCEEVSAFCAEAMAALVDAPKKDVPELLSLALKVGEANYKAMQELDQGHDTQFGTPAPCEVQTSAVKGKCILVSGHDIHDLLAILEKTAGKGINVYTHGEMLPANTYPELKKHKHLIGNWGGPWQLQKMEFSRFPGAIIMTSNCMVEPQKRYRERIFTRRFVGWEGIPHIGDDWSNFDAVVDAALSAPGFIKDEPKTSVPAGYGHKAVVGMAGPILEAIKSGDVKRFFVIGGCDGTEGERSYFRDVATNVPNDSVVITMGCGKYRFNREEFKPTAGGIPRLLDAGQCNDAYAAIQIAGALAGALGCKVTDLPLSFAISWFEQKAVAVLLTMLHLGLPNIYLGPALPAFATPNMLKILVDTYGIRGINHANYESDLKQMIQGK
ncbi:hybrid cluster protein [Tribonema minus]|uniref:Hybrid cluster protein n=1 Tax=Tribonema minus TaxID=303371 RepID=A0A835ZPX2_9STRA|nr:hybrid cluster protein [Tribonema minus]